MKEKTKTKATKNALILGEHAREAARRKKRRKKPTNTPNQASTRTTPAKNFMAMRETLDNLNENCEDIDVIGIMEDCAEESIADKRSSSRLGSKKKEGNCRLSALNTPKKSMPAILMRAIKALKEEDATLVPWEGRLGSTSLSHTWFVCYIYDIVPDITKPGWEEFHCSHICNDSSCVASDHLCWESHKTKLSRRLKSCRAPCPNGDDCENNCVNSCHCQGIHEPHCL
jgi:hypothetical protein